MQISQLKLTFFCYYGKDNGTDYANITTTLPVGTLNGNVPFFPQNWGHRLFIG